MKIAKKEFVYLHMQEKERFVISLGWDVATFMKVVCPTLPNILLLNHRLDHVNDFDTNTRMDFIAHLDLLHYNWEDHVDYSNFSWMDFELRENLEDTSTAELSEILYLEHMKKHLRAPFYPKMHNNWVYLSDANDSFHKLYFRSSRLFYSVYGQIIAETINGLRQEKSLLGLSRKGNYPGVPVELMMKLSPLISEGILFSLTSPEQTRLTYEIPIWVVGDYQHEYDIVTDFSETVTEPRAWLILTKKTKEWSLKLR